MMKPVISDSYSTARVPMRWPHTHEFTPKKLLRGQAQVLRYMLHVNGYAFC
jgi:hypothetical protein